jgi:sugar/nucleoside kinase (ribokinase family)
MFPKDSDRRVVVGIGSALVDILVHETDDFLRKAGAVKGGMAYVDNRAIDKTIRMASKSPFFVPGGSACNTVIGVGRLGGHARFVGKSGNGNLAGLFESDLKSNNVEPWLFKSTSLTGRVLSIITPDAQRSMLTYLGASAEAQPGDITPECFGSAAVVHVEGYLLFNQELILAALDAATRAGAKISLDLASFTVVHESKAFLEELVQRYVDILIANEDEARAFTGHTDEERALAALAQASEIAVLKLGERGSLIAYNGRVYSIAPRVDRPAVDTTGAGDLWASGFLYGLVNDLSIEQSGELGSLCGYEVCQVVGAKISDEGWQRIKTTAGIGAHPGWLPN